MLDAMKEQRQASPYRCIMVMMRRADAPSAALARARALALGGGVSVHLYLFEHESAITAFSYLNADAAKLTQEAFLRHSNDWLQQRASALRADGIDVQSHVIWGTPVHEQVLDQVLELAPDLVLKDAGSESPLRRLLLTPLDWKLLRLCPAPLMLIKGDGAALPGRAVVAVDPVSPPHDAGQLNQRLVEAGRQLVGIAGVELAHSFEPVTTVGIAEPLGSAVWLSQASERLRELGEHRLCDFAREQGVTLEHLHLLSGSPSTVLPALVRQLRADLLILGSVHRHGLERLLIGSTAERILQHAECDILVVKPEGFAERLAALRQAPAANPSTAPSISTGRPSFQFML
jgi:universal stress protein E